MDGAIIFLNKTEVIIRKADDMFPGKDQCEIIFDNGWDYGHSYFIPKEDIDKVVVKLMEVKQQLPDGGNLI